MTKIKTKNGECDLDELATAPIPRDALDMLLQEHVSEEIQANCSKETIDGLGETLIAFGDALGANAPPSLRLDFNIEGMAVFGKIIVQGQKTQSFSGSSVAEVVAASMRGVSEQNAFQADDLATRITVMTLWSRMLSDVSKGLDNSINAMLAANELKNKFEKERAKEAKKPDADSSDGKNGDG